MILHYSDWFCVTISAYRSRFEKVDRYPEGCDITPENVMLMLTEARDQVKQIGGNLQSALVQLSINHLLKAFEKPGQKEPSIAKAAHPVCWVVFGKEKPTFNTLSNYIKTIPEYHDYLISPSVYSLNRAGENVNADKNWRILHIINGKITLIYEHNINTIVVDPDNLKVVDSDLPEFNGNVLTVFEKIMAPTQFSPILPAQREEFFGKNR